MIDNECYFTLCAGLCISFNAFYYIVLCLLITQFLYILNVKNSLRTIDYIVPMREQIIEFVNRGGVGQGYLFVCITQVHVSHI